MSETFRLVITEHAAWRITERGRYRVFTLPDGGQWLVRANGGELLSFPLMPSGGEPRSDVFTLRRPKMATPEAPELFAALAVLGTVARFRTSDLWEAIATAIIRQVVRAAQSKRLYRDFCQAHGQRITSLNGEGYALFPTAETALGLQDEQFASAGLTFKRRPLRAAAEAYLKYGAHWRDLLTCWCKSFSTYRVSGRGRLALPWPTTATISLTTPTRTWLSAPGPSEPHRHIHGQIANRNLVGYGKGSLVTSSQP